MNTQITDELFIFHHEDSENTSSGSSASVDIGIYTRKKNYRGKRFFAIEAKRLTDKINKNREREYVIGRFENGKFLNTGAIERFKKEIHGKNLSYSGVLAYIQSDDFNSWENKINSWIDEEIKESTSKELSWSINDKLTNMNSDKEIAKYYSNHLCLSRKNIELTHIWINLNE